MGNAPPSAKPDEATPPTPSAKLDEATPSTSDEFRVAPYQWPENLYHEARDMAAASFLVYTFGYILQVARDQPGAIVGLSVDDEKRKVNKRSSAELSRSFTPHEVALMVQENAALLADAFPREFKDPSLVEQSLEALQKRVDENRKSGTIIERPLTLCEYDDKHQQHELVYAVAVDGINKRVTLAFRGTDNDLAFFSDWSTNMYMSKTAVPLPESLKGKINVESVELHSGFYNYLFNKTFDDSDDPERKKFDEIMDDVKPLLAANPGYKLYVTGHSLGGALSGMTSFFLACDDSIPKPVTCLNFASPRIGDFKYLQAVQVLERSHQLRFCRVNNDNDSICVVPMYNYYHAGFQVRLYRDATQYKPEVTFPKVADSTWNRWKRTWGNSLPASLNMGYDHGDYRERIESNRAALEAVDLNSLYKNVELTGFTMDLVDSY